MVKKIKISGRSKQAPIAVNRTSFVADEKRVIDYLRYASSADFSYIFSAVKKLRRADKIMAKAMEGYRNDPVF